VNRIDKQVYAMTELVVLEPALLSTVRVCCWDA